MERLREWIRPSVRQSARPSVGASPCPRVPLCRTRTRTPFPPSIPSPTHPRNTASRHHPPCPSTSTPSHPPVLLRWSRVGGGIPGGCPAGMELARGRGHLVGAGVRRPTAGPGARPRHASGGEGCCRWGVMRWFGTLSVAGWGAQLGRRGYPTAAVRWRGRGVRPARMLVGVGAMGWGVWPRFTSSSPRAYRHASRHTSHPTTHPT